MNCLKYRQLKLSDPSFADYVANKHRDECRSCADFDKEITALDLNVNQALAVAVPEGLAARIMLNRSLKQPQRKPTQWLWLSMAASFFAVALISYQFFQEAPIAEPLLAHINHQPHEFSGAEHVPIPNDKLQSVLDVFNIDAKIENVVYAAICLVDGEEAVHLVVKDGVDQYTVMLLPDYSPSKTIAIDNGMWRGYITPQAGGSIAVIADSDQAHAVARLKEMRNKYRHSINIVAGI